MTVNLSAWSSRYNCLRDNYSGLLLIRNSLQFMSAYYELLSSVSCGGMPLGKFRQVHFLQAPSSLCLCPCPAGKMWRPVLPSGGENDEIAALSPLGSKMASASCEPGYSFTAPFTQSSLLGVQSLLNHLDASEELMLTWTTFVFSICGKVSSQFSDTPGLQLKKLMVQFDWKCHQSLHHARSAVLCSCSLVPGLFSHQLVSPHIIYEGCLGDK